MELYNLLSLAGVFVLPGFAWLISSDRRVINWRVVACGIILQLVFAFFIFVVPAGTRFFLFINDLVVTVLNCATAGARFLFGRLALPPGTVNQQGQTSLGFILAFQALPTIIFFGGLMGLLYYVGVMPRLIGAFAYVFTKLMRLSGAESLCTASNIFVGIESALTIRPHLAQMTASELCTILTAGMATIASSVMALYVFILQGQFPTIAGHLVSASILSAPAALVTSKLVMPETDVPKTLGIKVKLEYQREHNVIEAIINGAMQGVKLVVGIVAVLIAFLGLVALVDLCLSGIGGQINAYLGWGLDWSLRGLFGYLFCPFALVIGVPPADALMVSKLFGERIVMTEVVSYQDLARFISEGVLHHPRSALLAAYGLCGFAHVASLAIFIGGIGALAPDRLKELSRVGIRALVAATLACLMTGAVAGIFFTKGSLLWG
jgi:CNT family concentrative nucleoside transporter